ncbi:hypothetical protein B0H14DRAFT_3426308 [Mycena olivaceomarginata]|nr:hypothetical protein B0H14DRAFT_3426308 [Mycena olivaceomarginata]
MKSKCRFTSTPAFLASPRSPPLRNLFHGRAQVHPPAFHVPRDDDVVLRGASTDHYALHSRLPGTSCCLEASERPTFAPLLDAERAVPGAAAGSPCAPARTMHRTPPPASIGRPFEDERRRGRTRTWPFAIDPPPFRLLPRPSSRHCARSQRPHAIDPPPLCAVHSATTLRAGSRGASAHTASFSRHLRNFHSPMHAPLMAKRSSLRSERDVDQLGILASSTASPRIRYARLRTRNTYRRRCIHMVAVSTALHCLDIHRSYTLPTSADACVLCHHRLSPTSTLDVPRRRRHSEHERSETYPRQLVTLTCRTFASSASCAPRPPSGALRRVVRRRRGPTQILPVLLSIGLAIRNASPRLQQCPHPTPPPPQLHRRSEQAPRLLFARLKQSETVPCPHPHPHSPLPRHYQPYGNRYAARDLRLPSLLLLVLDVVCRVGQDIGRAEDKRRGCSRVGHREGAQKQVDGGMGDCYPKYTHRGIPSLSSSHPWLHLDFISALSPCSVQRCDRDAGLHRALQQSSVPAVQRTYRSGGMRAPPATGHEQHGLPSSRTVFGIKPQPVRVGWGRVGLRTSRVGIVTEVGEDVLGVDVARGLSDGGSWRSCGKGGKSTRDSRTLRGAQGYPHLLSFVPFRPFALSFFSSAHRVNLSLPIAIYSFPACSSQIEPAMRAKRSFGGNGSCERHTKPAGQARRAENNGTQ